MRPVLDVQFFQCVGERRAVSWYRRRGALDQCIISREGPAARAAEAGCAVAEALHEGYWGACFCFFCGWWGWVGHGFGFCSALLAVLLPALVSTVITGVTGASRSSLDVAYTAIQMRQNGCPSSSQKPKARRQKLAIGSKTLANGKVEP